MRAPKIQNETQFDGRTVNAIVRWVFRWLDLDGSGVLVKVRHTRYGTYAGRFYSNPHASGGWIYESSHDDYRRIGPKVDWDTNQLLICRIARDGYPRSNHVYDRRDGPEPWIVNDWREALVAITAHEAMHLRQFRTKKRGRGRFNEVETEWAAYRLWKSWLDRR